MEHIRHIYAVGQGSFAIESIGNITIAFDCGSTQSPTIERRINDAYSEFSKHEIDYLFISHFHKDHVDGLEHLNRTFKVKTVVVPMIPSEFKHVYNAATDNAFDRIHSIFNQSQFSDVSEDVIRDFGCKELWRWNAVSLIKNTDWISLNNELKKIGLDDTQFESIAYIAINKEKIKKAFEKIWGKGGVNSKGLIMLSHKAPDAIVPSASIERAGDSLTHDKDLTGCLYVGDANFKDADNISKAVSLLSREIKDEKLELMQIPHHGSHHNHDGRFLTSFISEYYFVSDKNTNRLSKSQEILLYRAPAGNLLVVDEHSDIVGITEVN